MTNHYRTQLYAEDVAVGDEGPTVVVEDLQREDFVRYAGASGDFNPVHFDEPYATRTGNPSAYSPGMLTCGFASHMLSDWFGLAAIDRFRSRFQARVWPDDTLTINGEITDVTRGENEAGDVNEAMVEAEFVVENQDGEAVLTGDVTATVPSRAASSR